MTKNINEIIEQIGQKAESFLTKKDLFKTKIDPIFDEIREFEKKILKHVEAMPEKICTWPWPNISVGRAKELLNDYIWCSNILSGTTHFDIYYPLAKYGHFVNWIPKRLLENDPVSTLFRLAWGCEQPQNIDLLAYQYAIVAMIHDELRIGQSCQTLYFDSSGDDVASRTAFEFVRLARLCANDPISRVTTTIITRLYNAHKSVELDLDKVAGDAIQEQAKGEKQNKGMRKITRLFKKIIKKTWHVIVAIIAALIG